MPLVVACDALIRYSESAFDSPPATATSRPALYPASIDLTLEDEAGERLIISGVIVADNSETPVAGAIMTIWHVDNNGEYGRFRGELQTDAHGRYEFRTIMPSPYQVEDTTRAAHIHYSVVAVGMFSTAGEILFADDLLLLTDPVILETDPEIVATNTITLEAGQDADGAYQQGEFNIVLQSR